MPFYVTQCTQFKHEYNILQSLGSLNKITEMTERLAIAASAVEEDCDTFNLCISMDHGNSDMHSFLGPKKEGDIQKIYVLSFSNDMSQAAATISFLASAHNNNVFC